MENKEEVIRLEQARQQHIKQYGSMLYCPDRDTLCFEMNDAWISGCQAKKCCLDDPDYIARREKNEKRNQRGTEKSREEETAQTIRNQSKMARSYVDKLLEEANRLEARSQEAFRRNRPNDGHTLFNEAKQKRFKAYEYAEKKGIRL